MFTVRSAFRLTVVTTLAFLIGNSANVHGADGILSESAIAKPPPPQVRLNYGRQMYLEGKLPSGETIRARVEGDVELSGAQVVCGSCHRRSGLGSNEGQEVVPPITGDILYAPLQLPVSKPPLPPLLRPAYTDASLKRAIRDGIDANGEPMSVFMPRYSLNDQQLDILISYLKSLNTDPAPGVTGHEIHFATVITDSIAPGTRKAFLDVLQVFIDQKNTETRYESKRAEKTPWHKDWLFKPYRKWVLHVWELKGSREDWQAQLEDYYRDRPVFAVLSGMAPGSWKPVHTFCEQQRVPCLFPVTSLPVIDGPGFYTLYLNRGMALEAEAVVQHLSDDRLLDRRLLQIYRKGDAEGETGAAALRTALESQGGTVTDIALQAGETAVPDSVLESVKDATVVLWLRESPGLEPLWKQLSEQYDPARIYLSATLYSKPEAVPANQRARVYFVQPIELPEKLPQLLARSTGWLRAKRIYSGSDQAAQGDAFFTLKMAAGGLKGIGGYFNRDYFIERIEHMVDNATYTSVYPRISLAPDQRFVSKGVYIARVTETRPGRLVVVTDWLVPGSRGEVLK